jgi:outer membrane protein assembly factor BamA
MRSSGLLFFFLLIQATALSQENADTLLSVREILFDGNETTKDFVILREMKLRPGEKITAEALEHDQQRIYNLQLFNKVDLELKPDGTVADIIVHVHERWYFVPFPVFGIRYRDLDKIYYGAGIVHQNFRGRNEKLFFSFALGYDRWVSLTYRNPKLTDDDDLFLSVHGAYSKYQSLSINTDYYDQINLNVGAAVGKRFGFYDVVQGWVNYDVWQISNSQIIRTASADGRDAYVSAGANYARDTRDVREYPLSGHLFSVYASKYGFGESQVNFFRYGFDARFHQPLSDDLSLGLRSYVSLVGGGVVPAYHHVFFGYGERIRGYFRNTLEGENITGANTELRIALLKPRYYTLPFKFIPQFSVLRYGLYFGLFADAGKIWNRDQGFSSQRWYAGYGAGFHFLLPYSLIVRTEYAFNNEGTGQFVLDFGASF